MLPLELTPATVVVLFGLFALVVLAVRRLTRRGMCDCHDHCGDAAGGCASCGAVDKMLADMERAAGTR